MIKRGFVALLFIALFSIVFYVSLTLASEEVMTVEANIFASVVSISVPERILLGDVNVGYKSEEKTFSVKNMGTSDISIKVENVNSTEEIFNYLSFKKTGLSTWYKIDKFSFSMDKPETPGGVTEQEVSMILDLSNYNGTITHDLIGYQAEILFIALEK